MSYCPTEIWPTYVWSLDTRVKSTLLTTAVSERQTVWNQISKKKLYSVYGFLKTAIHTTGKPMKEVTWLLLCLCTNGHRSAALARQPFSLWFPRDLTTCLLVPICWENTFSFFRQKSINRAVVTEQTTEAFDWKLIGFIYRGRIKWNISHSISMVCINS